MYKIKLLKINKHLYEKKKKHLNYISPTTLSRTQKKILEIRQLLQRDRKLEASIVELHRQMARVVDCQVYLSLRPKQLYIAFQGSKHASHRILHLNHI